MATAYALLAAALHAAPFAAVGGSLIFYAFDNAR